ncbi:LOW QUALITY PROTEIN: hypothetical protein CVT26_001097 [Gymnopilus dilepis]|uniref:Uncharacterized protein n=1 Tax=Gymnopilus dilepis TaxID=231916 RepID=A0A409WYJ5_9AGAR|nr:LOW QUALITY PROTEIN: hypothetical protein CVT26_001097 [Gymnopilus dilepis]
MNCYPPHLIYPRPCDDSVCTSHGRSCTPVTNDEIATVTINISLPIDLRLSVIQGTQNPDFYLCQSSQQQKDPRGESETNTEAFKEQDKAGSEILSEIEPDTRNPDQHELAEHRPLVTDDANVSDVGRSLPSSVSRKRSLGEIIPSTNSCSSRRRAWMVQARGFSWPDL